MVSGPDRIQIGGKQSFLSFGIDITSARKWGDNAVVAFRAARRAAVRAAARTAVAILRRETPQRFHKDLARGWTMRLREHTTFSEAAIINPVLLRRGGFGVADGRVFGLSLLSLLEAGSPSHLIEPRVGSGKKALASKSPAKGGLRHPVRGILHPGFRPSKFMRLARDAAQTVAEKRFNDELRKRGVI